MSTCLSRYFLVLFVLLLSTSFLVGQQNISLSVDVNAVDVQQISPDQKPYNCYLSRQPVISHQQALDHDFYQPSCSDPLIFFSRMRNTVNLSLRGIRGNWAYKSISADLVLDGEKISSVEVLANKISFQIAPAGQSQRMMSCLTVTLFIPEQDRFISFVLPVKWKEMVQSETFALNDQTPFQVAVPDDYSTYMPSYPSSDQGKYVTPLFFPKGTQLERRRPGKRMIEQIMPTNARSADPTEPALDAPPASNRPIDYNYPSTIWIIPQSSSPEIEPSVALQRSVSPKPSDYEVANSPAPATSSYIVWKYPTEKGKVLVYQVPY
ncbi:MAG: hypothetical protein R2824_26035 [Saprospiraceae bacterium]|nr:hypothetical protein [Lewinella sp.]